MAGGSVMRRRSAFVEGANSVVEFSGDRIPVEAEATVAVVRVEVIQAAAMGADIRVAVIPAVAMQAVVVAVTEAGTGKCIVYL
jgi:hypothetical protein